MENTNLAEKIILLAVGLFAGISGFLVVRLLNSIAQKQEDNDKKLNDHEKRLTIIETEHKHNHG